MIGTIVNSASIIVGGSIGLVIHKRLPERITNIVFQSIGLFTFVLGLQMTFRSEKLLVLVFSLVVGSILGELLSIEAGIQKFSHFMQSKSTSQNDHFAEGMLTAFLLFCMGSMTVLGAFEEGLGNSSEILLTKSIMDGFSALAFSASLGAGVLFSVIPLLLYQGGLTLFARTLSPYISEAMIHEISAVGGILLLGLALNLLNLKKISVANMLPSLVIAGLLARWFG